jgi:hypothetical protein
VALVVTTAAVSSSLGAQGAASGSRAERQRVLHEPPIRSASLFPENIFLKIFS